MDTEIVSCDSVTVKAIYLSFIFLYPVFCCVSHFHYACFWSTELYLLFTHKDAVFCICIWFLAETHTDLRYNFSCSPVLQKSLISVLSACFNIYRWMLKACVKYLTHPPPSGSLPDCTKLTKTEILTVVIMYSPQGLRIRWRFWWWWLLNSFLVEYMNIFLPCQVFDCCKDGYWKPYFFISSSNSWCYFIFWKLFLNPAGTLEGKNKDIICPLFLFSQFKGNIEGNKIPSPW